MKRIAFLIALALAACSVKSTPETKLGATYYPGIPSSSISDATATGRSILTAADAAAVRSILSIQNVGDLRNYAITRAITVLGLTNPTVVVDESFVAKTGSIPNFFAGTSTNDATLSGGWKKISATATPGNSTAWTQADYATGQAVSNVGTQKWYQLWLIKLNSAADSTAQVQFGWIDTGFSVVQPLVGMQGPSSTTKFRFYDGTTGATSSVNLDTSVHIIEHWGAGSGSINASVDGEATVSYTTAKTSAVTPFVQIVTGSGGAQTASIGHLIVITAQQ